MNLDRAEKLIDLIGRVNALDMDETNKDEIVRYLRWALLDTAKACWRSVENTAG